MENISEDLLEQAVGSSDMIHITYIKPLSVNGDAGYGIYSEVGEQLAVFQSYESAFFTARKYNLIPVSVH